MPPAPKLFVRRRVEATPLPLHSKDIRQQERDELAERLRELGTTHTQAEASVAVGLSRLTLYSFAKEYRITFKKPTRGVANGAV